MLAMVVSFLMLLMPAGLRGTPALFGGPQNADLRFENRAPQNLLLGKGETSGLSYYDVAITRQPMAGVLMKLDYSRVDTTFSFDMHHRVSLDSDFTYPAEIITNIEVLSGGTTSIGTFTMVDTIQQGDIFEEVIDKVSKAEVDRYVTPFGKKRVSLKLVPGSQSLSIVGKSVIITRGARTTQIEAPGQRIAVVSNFKFQENRPGTTLEID